RHPNTTIGRLRVAPSRPITLRVPLANLAAERLHERVAPGLGQIDILLDVDEGTAQDRDGLARLLAADAVCFLQGIAYFGLEFLGLQLMELPYLVKQAAFVALV